MGLLKKSGAEYLLVGLGNPGERYARTRHNVGFMAADYIAGRCGVSITRLRHRALTARAALGGADVLLMKPQTFMNASGEAVGEAARYYHIPPEHVLVMMDDVSLPVGTLRIRREGSPGGHNGLKSVEAHLGSPRYPRIKIGVGDKPGPEADLADHVLGALPPADLRAVTALFDDIYAAAALIIEGKIDQAMNAYNHNGGQA